MVFQLTDDALVLESRSPCFMLLFEIQNMVMYRMIKSVIYEKMQLLWSIGIHIVEL